MAGVTFANDSVRTVPPLIIYESYRLEAYATASAHSVTPELLQLLSPDHRDVRFNGVAAFIITRFQRRSFAAEDPPG